MEEGDRHAQFLAEPGELALGLVELPVRRDEAAVLVRIGIADHHLLHPALPAGGAAHHRHAEQVTHDGGRGAQVVDGLEQGDDRQGADLGPRGVEEHPRLLGQQVGAEDVRHRAGHRQDEGAEGLPVEVLAHLRDEGEGGQRLAGGVGQVLEGPLRVPRPREAGLQPRPPLGAVEGGGLAVAVLLLPQGAERVGGAGGVLAQVEAHRGESEDLHHPPHRAHEVPGQRLALRVGEAAFQHPQILDQPIGAGIVGA